jgi:glycerate-2-kinase
MADEPETVAEGETVSEPTPVAEKVAILKVLVERVLYVKEYENDPDYVKMADRDPDGKAVRLVVVAEGEAAADMDRLLDAFVMGQVTLP